MFADEKRCGLYNRQNDCVYPDTSKETIEAIKSMEFSLIGLDIWPANSSDLNRIFYFIFEQGRSKTKKEII